MITIEQLLGKKTNCSALLLTHLCYKCLVIHTGQPGAQNSPALEPKLNICQLRHGGQALIFLTREGSNSLLQVIQINISPKDAEELKEENRMEVKSQSNDK